MRHSIGYLFKEGVRSLWKNRSMALSSIGVLISCLLLIGVAGALSLNISLTVKNVEKSNNILVYLKDSIPTLTSIAIGEKLHNLDNIESSIYVPKDDALKSVIQITGADSQDDASLFAGLSGSNNPLPDAFAITMKDLSKYKQTVEEIKSIDGVDNVSDYSEVAQKLSSIDKLVRNGSLVLIVLLGIVALFIIANTIKVTMFSRRMEINIMKSVGATNWFVRVPFIVEGIIIGIIAGIISAGALYYAYKKMMEVILSLVPFMGAIDIDPIIWLVFTAYILAGTVFGVLGCGFSIGKYLNKEGEQAII